MDGFSRRAAVIEDISRLSIVMRCSRLMICVLDMVSLWAPVLWSWRRGYSNFSVTAGTKTPPIITSSGFTLLQLKINPVVETAK
jgi:hypothetical protein